MGAGGGGSASAAIGRGGGSDMTLLGEDLPTEVAGDSDRGEMGLCNEALTRSRYILALLGV